MDAGVSVMKGQEEVHIHAPMVISDAGIFNTYQSLLPKDVQTMPGENEFVFTLLLKKKSHRATGCIELCSFLFFMSASQTFSGCNRQCTD